MAEITTSDITTSDGVRLHVTDEGAGRPVVLIAGYGAPAASWQLQVAALRGEHRVVCIDRRGHGRSERASHGQRISRHAADVHDVMTALDLDDAVLVGSSMGASTVMGYLDLYADERLRGVVMVDQTPKMVNEGDWEWGFHGLTRQGVEEFVATFPLPLADRPPFVTMPAAEFLQAMAAEPAFSVDDTRALLRDHTEKDWRDVITTTTVPLLAVAGRQSQTWPWQHAEWMASAASRGDLAVVEDCGHAVMAEQPAAFNQLLQAFCD